MQQNKDLQNIFKNPTQKEYLLQSHPNLTSQNEELYIEQTINHKQLKQIVEMITTGVLRAETKFQGIRILLMNESLRLLRYTVTFAPEVTHLCLRAILKQIAMYLDRFETPLQEPQCIPLMLIAVDLFLLLPEQQSNQGELKRLIFHLALLQFVHILDKDQSHHLLLSLANDSEAIIQNGRVNQILQSLKLDYQQPHQQVLCLSTIELQKQIEIQRDLLLSIPLSQDKWIIPNLIRTYLYCIAMDHESLLAEDNLIQSIYAPYDQQILYRTILQHLNDPSHLTLPKFKQQQSISDLTKIMLKNETILSQLIQNALGKQDILVVVVEILIKLAQGTSLTKLQYSLSEIVISYLEESQPKLCQLLSSLNRNEQQRVYQIFSIKKVRNQGGRDILQDFLDEQGESFTYRDLVDESIEAIMSRVKNSLPINYTIEDISNLENIATQPIEVGLRAAAVEQLNQMFLRFIGDEGGFCRDVGVKVSQVRDFWSSVVQNILKIIEQQFESESLSTQVSPTYSLFMSSIIDLLACFHLFMPIQNQLRQYLTHSSTIFKITLHYIRNSTATKFLYVRTFGVIYVGYPGLVFKPHLNLCPLPPPSENPIVQHWALFYPLTSNANWYVTQYVESLGSGINWEDHLAIRRKLVARTLPIAQRIEWAYSMAEMGIEVEFDATGVQSLVLHPDFMGSTQMYLLRMLGKLDSLDKLQRQVMQMYSESQDSGELLSFHLRLCVINSKKPQVKEDLSSLFEQHPFHSGTAISTLKLARLGLLNLSKPTIAYLANHCLYQSDFRFSEVQLPYQFLSVTLGSNLAECVPQCVLFSHLMQFTRCRMTQLRCLALNHLLNHISSMSEDQQHRLSQECMDIVFGDCEAHMVFSLALQILNSLIVVEAHSDSNELKQLLVNRKFIPHSIYLLQVGQTLLIKSAVTRLQATLSQYYPKDFTVSLLQQLIPICKDLLVSVSLKRLATKKHINEAALYISGVSSLIGILMRQSVSQAIQIIQSINLIDFITRILRKISKVIQEDLAYSPFQLQLASIHIIHLIQQCCSVAGDIVCIDLRATKENKNYYFNLLTLLKVDHFDIPSLVTLVDSITSVAMTGYQELRGYDSDLVLCLNGIASQSDEASQTTITQAVSALISFSNQSKEAVIGVKLPEQILAQLSKELEGYIYQQPNKKKGAIPQLVEFTHNQPIKLGCTFLKLLLAKAEDGLESKFIGPTITQTIQILHKLHLIAQRHQIAMIYFQGIMCNLATNEQLSPIFVMKMSEDKFNLIQDLTKYTKIDNPNQELFEQSVRCLGVLGQNREFRLIYNRMKIIQDMNDKLYQMWDKKKTWQPTNPIAKSIAFFLLSMSFHKEETIIVNYLYEHIMKTSSKIMALYVTIIHDHGTTHQICQDILLMLSNCALKHKSSYLTDSHFIPLILQLISDDDTQVQLHSSQLLLNLMYKSTQSIAHFNRPEIIEEVQSIMKQTQRKADRIQLQTTSVSETDNLNKQRQLMQSLSNNLNQILKILLSEW